MAIFISALATACLLLFQAIHVLKTGDMRMFFLTGKRQDCLNTTRLSRRLAGFFIFGAPACALFGLLIFALIKNGEPAMISSIATNSGNFIGGIILFVFGLLQIIWPGWIVNGVQAAYTTVDLRQYEGLARGFVRIVGAILLLFGFILLSAQKHVP